LKDDKAEDDPTEIKPATAEDYEALLKEKAAQKFKDEQDRHGLLLISAFYGEREVLENLILARRGDLQNYDIEDPSRVRDISIPMRFWVRESSLYFPKGPKSFFNRGMKKPTNPAILIKYSLIT
jgi:hypothetical protein